MGIVLMRDAVRAEAGQGGRDSLRAAPSAANIHATDAFAPHRHCIVDHGFNLRKTQYIVAVGRNCPTHGMIGEPDFGVTCVWPHWSKKCRKLSSLSLSSPLLALLLARRKNRRRLRRRSPPNRLTPASTSNSARGQGLAAAPGLPLRSGARHLPAGRIALFAVSRAIRLRRFPRPCDPAPQEVAA